MTATVQTTSAIRDLAELAVRVGCNVQPGQILAVRASFGQEEIARAIAESGYQHHAKFVDVDYFDPYLKRIRITTSDPEALSYVPPWFGDRMRQFGDLRCARVALSGPPAPGLLEDLDPILVGKDQLPYIRETHQVVNDRTTNWTVVPGPHRLWAQLVHPDLPPDEALALLWKEVNHVLRLDTNDPIASWKERMAVLRESADKLTDRHFDAIHLEGPGTNITVGLLPTSCWLAAESATVDGIRHAANLPSEEVFTTPDPVRTEGLVSATRPLVMRDGTIVEGLTVRFERGEVVQVEARRGVDNVRGLLSVDPGVGRLGEIALVDRQGRVGALHTTFYDTLLDENAASHLALGSGYLEGVGEADKDRVNNSVAHTDFMVGGPAVTVTGITAAGDRIPIMRNEDWLI
jgi:aminopeptidase